MALDNAKNFAKVTVSTGYNSAATSVVLSTGDGARLPTAPFNVIWWNATDYGDPSDDPNVEIVRVTAISTDTLTVTRGQEGITATNKNTAGKTYRMIAGLTAKVINEDLTNTIGGSIKLSSDFVVTNNATLTDVTGFTIPAIAGEVWEIEISGSTSANNTTGDIKGELITTGTWDTSASFYSGVWFSGAGALVASTFVSVGSTNTMTGGSAVFNNGDGVTRALYIKAQVVMTASGDIKFQIANSSAAAGRTSTLKAGTIFCYRKVS